MLTLTSKRVEELHVHSSAQREEDHPPIACWLRIFLAGRQCARFHVMHLMISALEPLTQIVSHEPAPRYLLQRRTSLHSIHVTV